MHAVALEPAPIHESLQRGNLAFDEAVAPQGCRCVFGHGAVGISNGVTNVAPDPGTPTDRVEVGLEIKAVGDVGKIAIGAVGAYIPALHLFHLPEALADDCAQALPGEAQVGEVNERGAGLVDRLVRANRPVAGAADVRAQEMRIGRAVWLVAVHIDEELVVAGRCVDDIIARLARSSDLEVQARRQPVLVEGREGVVFVGGAVGGGPDGIRIIRNGTEAPLAHHRVGLNRDGAEGAGGGGQADLERGSASGAAGPALPVDEPGRGIAQIENQVRQIAQGSGVVEAGRAGRGGGIGGTGEPGGVGRGPVPTRGLLPQIQRGRDPVRLAVFAFNTNLRVFPRLYRSCDENAVAVVLVEFAPAVGALAQEIHSQREARAQRLVVICRNAKLALVTQTDLHLAFGRTASALCRDIYDTSRTCVAKDQRIGSARNVDTLCVEAV